MNEFERDDIWQLRLARRFLNPYYRNGGYEVERYPGKHPMQKLHVDVRLRHREFGHEHFIDEKIIRGLRKGGPAEKVNLETWSCSVPGKEKRGWICFDEPSEATVLLVGHAEEVCSFDPDSWLRVTFLDCLWIPFRPLRRWFREQDETQWKEVISDQWNHGIARAVPIGEIAAAIPGVRRGRLNKPFDGDCEFCDAPGLYIESDKWYCNDHWQKRATVHRMPRGTAL